MGPLDLLGSEGGRGGQEGGGGGGGGEGGGGEVEQADNTVRHEGRCVWRFTYRCLDILGPHAYRQGTKQQDDVFHSDSLSFSSLTNND